MSRTRDHSGNGTRRSRGKTRPADDAKGGHDRSAIRAQVEQEDYAFYAPNGVVVSDPSAQEPVPSPILTDVSPPAPTGLVATTGANENIVYFDVSWTAPTDPGFDNVASYNLQYKLSTATVWVTVRSTDTDVRVQPVEPLKDYDFRVQSVSWKGNAGSFTSTSTVAAGVDNDAPDQVVGLTLTAGLRTVFASFTANTEADLDHYRIQVDDTDATFGSLVHDGFADANLIAVSDLEPDTPYWVRVAALDKSANQGDWSTTQTISTSLTGESDLAVDSVTAAKLAAIELEVGKYIRSTTYSAGTAGWTIDANGNVEFNDGTFRGTLDASVVQANTIQGSTDNLVTNGDAEGGTTTGWTTSSGTVTITNDATEHYDGTKSIKVVCTSGGAGQNYSTPDVAVVEGGAYKWSIRLKRGGAADVGSHFIVVYEDALGATVNMPNGLNADAGLTGFMVTAAWREYTFTSLAPEGAVTANLKLVFDSPAGTCTLYNDALTCVRVTALDGGYATPDVVYSQTDVHDMTGLVMPPGVVLPWAGAVAADNVFGQGGTGGEPGILSVAGYPPGWLPCDGRAVSRTSYWRLFAVVGTTFGTGDGSTTFNVPDMRGRVPVALDNLGGTDAGRLAAANTLGGNGGSETQTLTTANLPSHDHGGTSGTEVTHVHGIPTTPVGSGLGVTVYAPGGAGSGFTAPGTSHSHSIPSQGSGTAHNNLQPYLLLNFIIKA